MSCTIIREMTAAGDEVIVTAAHSLYQRLSATPNDLPDGIYYTLNLAAWG